jgi:hypothetical protein
MRSADLPEQVGWSEAGAAAKLQRNFDAVPVGAKPIVAEATKA